MKAVASFALLLAALPASAAIPHHALEVQLDPAARTLRATDRITFGDARPDGFTMPSWLEIDRLLVGGTAMSASRTGDRVALPPGARELTIEYHGTLAPLPAGDAAAGEAAVAGLAGAFLPPATWYPSFDVPAFTAFAAFTWTLAVEVPAGQRAVAAGRLDDEHEADGRWRATFASDAPGDELVLAAGPWVVAERWHHGRRLRTWLHPEVAAEADAWLDAVAGYLDLYEGWIGPYPFAGFQVASSPLPLGLGFPGLTVLGVAVVRLPFIRETSLGHEVLHCWWGNGVRVDAASGNWSEGLTTFMADYTFVERRSADEARELRRRWLRELAILPPDEDIPIAAFRTRRHTASQAVGYHKVALVLGMLRDEIGADAFTDGVRRFWDRHRLQTAGWGDLQAAFATAAGRPLDTFFHQWLQRRGAPALALRDARRDGDTVTFTLSQAAPPWSLVLPIALETDAGTLLRSTKLDTTERRVGLDLDRPANAVAVDPDDRIVRRLDRGEIPPILREAAFDPATATILAASGDEAIAAARDVATHLLERPPRLVAPRPLADGPLLVVGTTAEVKALLAQAALPPAPAEVAAKPGSARVWAARRPDGAALLVVEAEDANALRAIAGPLPHWGSQSWLVFDGRQATQKGVWPAPEQPLRLPVR